MMTVLALLLIFASFALPTYQTIVLRAREATLRDDLYTMRSMIDRFTLDNKRPPASLEELVEAHYLGAIPSDPFTRSTDTWQVEFEEVPVASDQAASGIVDVHSGSDMAGWRIQEGRRRSSLSDAADIRLVAQGRELARPKHH